MKRFGALVIAAVRVAAGQTLAFDAASVKPNRSGDWRKRIGAAPGGASPTHAAARPVAFAYGVSRTLELHRRAQMDRRRSVRHRRQRQRHVDTGSHAGNGAEVARGPFPARRTETRELPTYVLVVASAVSTTATPWSTRPPAIRRGRFSAANHSPRCPARHHLRNRTHHPGTITAIGGSMTSLASSLVNSSTVQSPIIYSSRGCLISE